jgi:acetyl esterase/lipase
MKLAILIALFALHATAAIADGFVDRPAQIPPAIQTELDKIGPIVAPPPTEALYKPLHPREPYAGVAVTRDIHYGADERNRLDLFAPATIDGKRPVLVFVHGGAFMRGDKRTGDSFAYDNIMLWAVRHGMVGVNMTYRLAPAHVWPSAQEDIDAALAWVRGNIASSGGDPDRVFLMGHSAGAAHIAQYAGHPEFHVAPGPAPAGYILVSGLFDPATEPPNPPKEAYFGKDAAAYVKQNAVPGIVAAKVPVFIAFAEHDPQEFRPQAQELVDALTAAGRPPAAYRLLGNSHMSEIYAVDTDDDALTAPLAAFVSAPK